MSLSLIGLCLNWAAPLDPAAPRRLAAALGAGLGGAGACHVEERMGFVRHALTGATGWTRGWRPVAAPGGGQSLFVGRLDNPDELARALGLATDDATTLYAHGLSAWGDAVDQRAIGCYATIFVPAGGRSVRLAASPLLNLPLYIATHSQGLAVASLSRAALAAIDRRAEIDERKLADSLMLNYGEAERDWLAGVERVAPGTIATVTPAGVTRRRFWDAAALPEIRLRRDADYVEAAEALLIAGHRAALRGAARPAVSLSRGYDSQAIAVFTDAVHNGAAPILTLTAVPEPGWQHPDEDLDGDEGALAAALCARYPSMTAETIETPGLDFDHKLGAMFFLAGGAPRNVSNFGWIHALREHAKARGCDVVLHGVLGNDGFSFDGHGALPSWAGAGRWRTAARALPAVQGKRGFARAAVGECLLPWLPDVVADPLARLRGTAPESPFSSWCPLNPDYARAMDVEARARLMPATVSDRRPRSTRAFRSDMLGAIASEAGPITQAMDLIHGIPARAPLAYRPLIEFCLGIPDDQFWRGTERRRLARRVLRGRVPDAVVDATRFAVQGADWRVKLARQRPALLDELAGLARDPAMTARLDLARLRAALEAWSPQALRDRTLDATLRHALPRAIATARFIRYVEGSNAP